MTPPPRPSWHAAPSAAPLAPVDGDQAAALDRLGAALGPVEVVEVRAYELGAPPGPGGAAVQGCLFAKEATG